MAKGLMSTPHDEPNEFEHYPTPKHFVKQLVKKLPSLELDNGWCLDVGCGDGVLGREVRNIFPKLKIGGIDIRDVSDQVSDFDKFVQADVISEHVKCPMMNIIITNPPFKMFTEFAKFSFGKVKENGVILMIGWFGILESEKRTKFWQEYGHTLRSIIIPHKRVAFVPGKTGLQSCGFVFSKQPIDNYPSFQWVKGGQS